MTTVAKRNNHTRAWTHCCHQLLHMMNADLVPSRC